MNEEQLEEFGALESIYPDIIQRTSENSFDVIIVQDLQPDLNDGVRMNVIFTETYPQEPPIVTFRPIGDASSFIIEEIKEIVGEVTARSLNSPMIFDIIEEIREYLRKVYTVEEEKPQQIFRKTYETFTAVSLETFLQWKKNFDNESKEKERVYMESVKNNMFINGLTYSDVWGKPTGRQLFESGFEEEEIKEDEAEVV